MSKFLLQNKIYFFILSLFSILVVFYSFYKNNIQNLYVLFLSIVFISLLLIIIYYFIINKLLFYFPINILFNLYLLVTFLFTIYHFNYILLKTYPVFFNELNIIDFQNLFSDTIIILIFTVFFFNLAFFLTTNLFKKKMNYFPNLNELQLIRLNFYLMFIKLIFLLLHIFFDKSFQELLNPLNLLIVLLNFYLINFFKNNRFLFFIIILSIFMENFLITSSLFKNAILIIVCFFLLYNLKHKISILLIIILMSWIFLGQSYKVKVRTYILNFDLIHKESSKNKASKEKIENINYFMSNITDYDFRPVILRLSEPIVSLIRVLEYEKLKSKEIKKDTLSILKYSFVPRIFYKDKPTQNFSAWYTENFFTVYQTDPTSRSSVTFNIFWPTDFYINNQYWGSVFISFFVGLLLSILSVLLTNNNLNNLNYLIGVALLSPMSFPDYNFSLMFSPVIFQFIFLFIIIKFFLFILSYGKNISN